MAETTELTRCAVNLKIIKAAIPVMVQNTSTPIYVIIDTMIVGHLLGVGQLAGLNIGSMVTNAVLGICLFMSYVTNAQVSNAIGRGKRREAIEYGRNGAWLGLFMGIALMLVFMFGARQIAGLFTLDQEVIEYSSLYLQAVSIALPGHLVSLASYGLMRGVKMYQIPMYSAIGGGVVNIIFNIIFVVSLKMGIFGSGLATGVTMVLMGIVNFSIVLYFVHKEKVSRRFKVGELLQPLIESFPYVIRNTILWLSILIIVRVIAQAGTGVQAGYQIVNSCWNFVEIAIEALMVPLQTFIGEALGARDVKKAKFIYSCAIRLGMWLSVFLMVADLVAAFIAPYCFTSDPHVMQLAKVGFLYNLMIFFHTTFTMVSEGAMIAAGDTKFMAKMTLISALIYIPLCYFIEPLMPTESWVSMVIALSLYDFGFLGIRAVLAFWRMRKDRWLKGALSGSEEGTIGKEVTDGEE